MPVLVSRNIKNEVLWYPCIWVYLTRTHACTHTHIWFKSDQHLTFNQKGTSQSLNRMLQQHKLFISRWRVRSSSKNFEIINHVPSSGFSLVIRAAITWPHGCGFCRGLSKSIDESPHGDSPYNWRISLMRLNRRPIAICNHRPYAPRMFSKYISHVRHPTLFNTWIRTKERKV